MKLKTKFTKGPWKIENGYDKNGDGKYFPSVVLSESYFANNDRIVVNVSHDQKSESLQANAVLIAHAPELFAVLQEMVTYPIETRNKAKKLLKKIANIW